MADRFVPAWYDYGVRKGPALGVGFHMAEGGGTVSYLDKVGNPPRLGVSVHAVIEYDGSLVQMLNYDHACGGLHPGDIGSEKAYYKGSIFKAVMGKWWSDPNSASIQCEIEGFASAGPNAKQVATAIRWVNTILKPKYSTLHGAFGHADQTDEKACPGTTAAMKSIFNSIGGHGVWSVVKPDMSYPVPTVPSVGDVVADGVLYTTNPPNEADPQRIIINTQPLPRTMPWLGTPSAGIEIVEYVHDTGVHSGKSYYVKTAQLTNKRPVPPADTKHTVTVNVDGATKATITV